MAIWMRIQQGNSREMENYRRKKDNESDIGLCFRAQPHYQYTHGTRSSQEDTARAAGK
jgi:hypothetical protein